MFIKDENYHFESGNCENRIAYTWVYFKKKADRLLEFRHRDCTS